MLLRMTHFIASWYQSLARIEKDNWGLQSSAESGKGTSGVLWPVLALLITGAITYTSWVNMSSTTQSVILQIGWPVLAVASTVLTLTMAKKLVRRQRGYRV
jgi:hypothetical protein